MPGIILKIKCPAVRAVEKIKYPISLAFYSAFFVAMKLTYLDMLA
jgi:hypothetical protein